MAQCGVPGESPCTHLPSKRRNDLPRHGLIEDEVHCADFHHLPRAMAADARRAHHGGDDHKGVECLKFHLVFDHVAVEDASQLIYGGADEDECETYRRIIARY